MFTFANQAVLDMLETTLIALQDISLEKILQDISLRSEFPKITQQVYKASGFAFASLGL
jgi:homeobox-leucine zipper protein